MTPTRFKGIFQSTTPDPFKKRKSSLFFFDRLISTEKCLGTPRLFGVCVDEPVLTLLYKAVQPLESFFHSTFSVPTPTPLSRSLHSISFGLDNPKFLEIFVKRLRMH
jgi:hypothetical protein